MSRRRRFKPFKENNRRSKRQGWLLFGGGWQYGDGVETAKCEEQDVKNASTKPEQRQSTGAARTETNDEVGLWETHTGWGHVHWLWITLYSSFKRSKSKRRNFASVKLSAKEKRKRRKTQRQKRSIPVGRRVKRQRRRARSRRLREPKCALTTVISKLLLSFCCFTRRYKLGGTKKDKKGKLSTIIILTHCNTKTTKKHMIIFNPLTFRLSNQHPQQKAKQVNRSD